MRLLQLLSCALGRHRRDKHRIWYDGTAHRAYCQGCGKPMVRLRSGWGMADRDPPNAPPN